MPFLASLGSEGYGRQPLAIVSNAPPSGALPAYYTSSSGYLMYQPGFNSLQLQLKLSTDIGNSNSIRTYSGLSTCWTYIHDKDLDSNVWYGMQNTTFILSKYVLSKGGTSVTKTDIYTYSAATTNLLGGSYAPSCMWTGIAYGAYVVGGFGAAVVHVLEFNSTKTGIRATYTVPYTSEVYGTEVIPSQASGFTNHYGVAYTRASKQMSSWTVNMDTRTWSNRRDNSYSSGINGPSNGSGMIYYPPGKPIFTGDPDTGSNRLAMNDTNSATLYVWTVSESGTQLNWTFLKTVSTANNGGYPYHMSTAAYNAVS